MLQFTSKLITGIICILFSVNASAQKAFVRVYNQDDKLITKGKLLPGTDSTIELSGRDSTTEIISLNNVGSVKTKHTAGHSILWGSIIGAGTLGAVGIFGGSDPTPTTYSAEFWFDLSGFDITTGESIAIGAITGTVLGGLTGTIIGVTKKRQKFSIDGSTEKWKEARKKILGVE